MAGGYLTAVLNGEIGLKEALVILTSAPASQMEDILRSAVLFRYSEEEIRRRIRWAELMDGFNDDKQN